MDRSSDDAKARLDARMAKKTGRRKGQQHCIFCGRSPTTREHIFPQWLRKAIGYDHTLRGPMMSTAVDLHPVRTFIRAGPPEDFNLFQLRRWILCKSCNGSWGERDGEVVEPVVRGSACTLSTDDQMQLARWSVKTMMTYEFASSSESILISPEYRRWFYEVDAPPPGSYVWLGSTDEAGWRRSATQAKEQFSVQSDTGQESAFMLTGVLHLGEAQIFVLISDLDVPVDDWPDFPCGAVTGTVPDGLRRIWPTSEPIAFPIMPKLADDDAQQLVLSGLDFGSRVGSHPTKHRRPQAHQN